MQCAPSSALRLAIYIFFLPLILFFCCCYLYAGERESYRDAAAATEAAVARRIGRKSQINPLVIPHSTPFSHYGFPLFAFICLQTILSRLSLSLFSKLKILFLFHFLSLSLHVAFSLFMFYFYFFSRLSIELSLTSTSSASVILIKIYSPIYYIHFCCKAKTRYFFFLDIKAFLKAKRNFSSHRAVEETPTGATGAD